MADDTLDSVLDSTLEASIKDSVTYLDVEGAARESLSIHWRAVFAGTVVAILTHLILMSLGLALGAAQVSDLVTGDANVRALSSGAGAYLLVSVLFSLFVGSYASARVSGLITTRVGYTQGAVISALFFAFMVSQAGALFGSSFGAVKSSLGGALDQALRSERLSSVIEDAVGDLNLKTTPGAVASGVLARVLRGDANAAVSYLAAQSGLTRAEAQERYARLQSDVERTSLAWARRGAELAQTAAWVTFATLVTGLIGSLLGGALGAQLSLRAPLGLMDRRALQTTSRTNAGGLGRPAYT